MYLSPVTNSVISMLCEVTGPEKEPVTGFIRNEAAEELQRMEEAGNTRREQEKLAGKTKDSQKLFKPFKPKTRKALCSSRVPFLCKNPAVMEYN